MSDNIKFDARVDNYPTPGFTSSVNKGILWDLMYNNGMFAGLSSEHVETVRNTFEQVVAETDILGESVTAKNKHVLTDITKHVREMYHSFDASVSIPVTAGELSVQRRAEFDNNLNRRREEFDSMVSRAVPKQIDFSDQTDEPLSGNMENIINDVISKREKQFDIVTKTHQDGKSGDKQTIPPRPSNTELKIGDTVIEEADITDVSLNKDRHVSFVQDNAKYSENVVQNKLVELQRIVSRVESNQDTIMNILKEISSKILRDESL